MLRPSSRRRIVSTALVLALSLCCQSSSASGHKSPPTLTPENRAQVNRLLQEYRTAGVNLDKKEEICRKALELGPAAVPLMLAAVQRDLQPQLKRYLAKFQVRAAAAARKKLGKVDFNKVAQLRTSILDLQKLGDGFTKEVIVEKIDPAMEKLRAVFILDRGAVLDKSPDLQAERKKLDGLGRLWEMCHAQMPPAENGDKKPEEAAPKSFDDYLQGEEDLAASGAIPQDARTRAVLALNARLAEKLDPEEANAILALNVSRTLLGLPALAIDLKLCQAARGHSKDMERLNFFSHESPVPGKKTPWDRGAFAGTSAAGENIFKGSTSGKTADQAWFHSPGHHRNQMGNFVRIGVGRSGVYFTQMFGR